MTASPHDSPPPAPPWLTVAAGLMIAAAGAVSWWALVLRWGSCSPSFETGPCGIVQDHLYDYFLPTAPSAPVPGTVVLEGVVFLLLAAALAVSARRHLIGSAVGVLWWALIGTAALIGALNLASGLTSTTLPPGLRMAMILLLVGLVPLIAVLARVRGVIGWLFVVVLAAMVVHQTPFDVGSIYNSHDTNPWTGATSATSFAALGIAIVAARLAQRGGRDRRRAPRA